MTAAPPRMRVARLFARELAGGLGPILLLLILWQVAYLAIPRNTFLRGPLEALGFLADPGNLVVVGEAVGSTLSMLGAGYLIALGVALALACLVTAHVVLDRAISPLALGLGVIPVVVITPVVILLFGRGPATSIAVCVMITFFSSFVSLASGMRSVSPTMLDVAAVLGAGPVRTVLAVRLPSAVPSLLSATKLALPAALSGVILTEYIATGRGIGTFINYARANYHYIDMWAGILVVAVASALVYVLLGTAEILLQERFAPGRGKRSR